MRQRLEEFIEPLDFNSFISFYRKRGACTSIINHYESLIKCHDFSEEEEKGELDLHVNVMSN